MPRYESCAYCRSDPNPGSLPVHPPSNHARRRCLPSARWDSGGGQEVSRGWGLNGNTHTIHIAAWVGGAYRHWLVDFTRGVGFANYRPLTVNPARDLMCSCSSIPGQERIMYIHTGSQLVRYNTATMQTENTGN